MITKHRTSQAMQESGKTRPQTSWRQKQSPLVQCNYTQVTSETEWERQLEKIRLPELRGGPSAGWSLQVSSSDMVLTKKREAKQHVSSLRGYLEWFPRTHWRKCLKRDGHRTLSCDATTQQQQLFDSVVIFETWSRHLITLYQNQSSLTLFFSTFELLYNVHSGSCSFSHSILTWLSGPSQVSVGCRR